MSNKPFKPKKKKESRHIACGDETVSFEESLPYPVVYYPAHYGAFTAFKPDTECRSFTFCECSRPALYNYVRLLKAAPAGEREACMHSRKLVDMREFPISFLLQDKSKDLDEFYDSLIFKPGLCHVCRKEIPSYAYCADMYGSKLEQNYGWYKKQDTFKRGIYYSPADGASRFIAADGDIVFFDPSNPPDFLPAISDDVQTRLGTADKWKNETALYNTVLSLYPKLTAVRHYRAAWLENLELDIFIQELKTGIEYQGIQHYKPLKHWGGEDGLKKRIKNDQRKKDLCREHGVQLVYFTYQEPVTPEAVSRRLSKYA